MVRVEPKGGITLPGTEIDRTNVPTAIIHTTKIGKEAFGITCRFKSYTEKGAKFLLHFGSVVNFLMQW